MITIEHHEQRSSRYDAALYCMRRARDARIVANRTLDPVASERAELECRDWLALQNLINASARFLGA